MDTIEKHTISIHFVNAAIRHLNADDRSRVLGTAGISEGLLSARNARVPANSFSVLWLAVAQALDDEFFGLDCRRMKVGSFALLSQAALACPNLDRALRRILRGLSLFLDEMKGQLRLEKGEATVWLSNGIADEADRRFADETMLVLIHGLMCWLVGRRVEIVRLDFAFRRPDHAQEYRLMYCSDVRFDATQTCMRFHVADLESPVAQTPASLQTFLRTAPQSVFLKYRNEESWGARVRKRLRSGAEGPDTWPVFDSLAREFGISATTLRRRLDSEKCSYRSIKDQLRNDLAIDQLCNSNVNVDDIGASLGFNDASAFHRAFKRWNGIQPGEYRRRRRPQTTAPALV
ncbi:AraC family transcriptional regulator [Hydrogenophaga sp. BPS33]|uniref:AraC family transcriptional regulator n=1 Tax=Hydrogenophaga sp. BPS33 TaxID=2651974 RepID=UPI00131FAC22|nr:AraC family transcriptional regulator [Hydrogenophaga sp. BPS33]QHE84872.1 AraC family transcriptional regulator [Hydrogenophaga sp. BPS33]